MRFLLPIVLLVVGCANREAEAGPVVRVSGEIVRESTPRLGVNLGTTYYAGDAQYVVNPFLHGGFAKGRQVLIVAVGTSDGATFTDANFEASDPDRNYVVPFTGGTYTIATGSRAGETGEITAHDLKTGTYTLEKSGAPLAESDMVWLQGPWTARAEPDPTDPTLERTIGIGDFRVAVDEDVKLDFVDNPDNPRDQFLRLTCPATEGRHGGGIKHYIRATPNNTYRITVRARADASGVLLGTQFKNLGVPYDDPSYITEMVCKTNPLLTEDWQTYVFEGKTFSDTRLSDRMTEITIGAAMAGGVEGEKHVFFDWVKIEDENSKSPTGFRKEIVDTLREAKVGTVRFYSVASLASTVDALTAASTTDAPWSFVSLESRMRMGDTDAVVDEWFKLSQEVGADPWLTIGGGNTPEDWYRLISYIAAPRDFDADAARRAEHGHAAPWTDAFDKVYLEIGNEWWNPIFSPYYVWSPEKYGELCNTITERIVNHPHFDPERMEIIAGGWAINAHHWNGQVDKFSLHHDRVSLAPYLVHELNDAESLGDGFQAIFADVEGYSRGGGASTLADLKANGKGTGLAIYELNTHITGGNVSTDQASALCTSTAAGVAVLDQALHCMTELGTSPINYFTLLQRGYNDRLGLWGSLIRTEDGSLRARPIWHGLRMANRYLGGALLRTMVGGGATWDQPENGSVPEMDDVPYLHTHAIRDMEGTGLSVFVINRHLTDSFSPSIVLPGKPSGEATRIVLGAPDPATNNEESELVTLHEETLSGFASGDTLLVPPASAVILHLSSVESIPAS